MASIERLLEMLDRAHDGPICTEKEWNTRVLPAKVAQKLSEYGLRGMCDIENPVNTDDQLADRFFKAGCELALEMGLLCQNTEVVVRVTQEELDDALTNTPSELAFGKGRDRVAMKHRKPEDKHPPLCTSPRGVVVSEDIWIPLYQAILQYRGIDLLHCVSLLTMFGHRLLAGTPYEILLGKYVAQLMREVLSRAGRPGMPIDGIATPTAFGQLGGLGIPGGLDPAKDGAIIGAPGEMLTNYMVLHQIAHAINCGAKFHTDTSSMIGGYPGPPEGTVLARIANILLQSVIHQTDWISSHVMDVRYGGHCGREGQWVLSVSTQAISRNTNLLHKSVAFPVADAGTEMVLYECTMTLMNLAVSGVTAVGFPGASKYMEHINPLESKFGGEVAKRSAGMTRKKVNEIAKVLIPKYESKLYNPPTGKSFRECYDLKTLKPTEEALDIYLKVKRELIELGVPLEYP